VYGERATPYEVLAQLGDRIAGEYAADDVLHRVASIVASGVAAAPRSASPKGTARSRARWRTAGGFDRSATSYGTGMQRMLDRLEALGGGMEVDTAPNRGTIVRGRSESPNRLAL
jgi:hypothetical protein